MQPLARIPLPPQPRRNSDGGVWIFSHKEALSSAKRGTCKSDVLVSLGVLTSGWAVCGGAALQGDLILGQLQLELKCRPRCPDRGCTQ